MKTNKIIYWIATVIVVGMTGMAGVMYFANPMVAEGFKHLGFSNYFRVELGIAKLIAAVVLIIPMIPARLKEWAYVGLGITFVSAIVAHSAVDGFSTAVMPIVTLVILAVSYIYYHRVNDNKSVAA